MQLVEARDMCRMILGDGSESVWSDTEIAKALNFSNKRIMARIVEQNPDQYLITYEEYMAIQLGDESVAPLSYASGAESISLSAAISEGMAAAEGHSADADFAKLTANPIRVVRLFYSSGSGLKDRIEIPIVPFDALDERKEQQVLEYEVLSNMRQGARIYKASYSPGTTILRIRPIPPRTMYLKIYWAEAGVMHLDPDATSPVAEGEQRLLMPYYYGNPGSEKHAATQFVNTPKAEAVVFDACWSLSFKDQSMREACAMERERILATQFTPMSPSEAY